MATHQRRGGFTDEEFVPLDGHRDDPSGSIDSALN